ncbi:unnamed protein product, partial [marine sediment metagenome]
MFPNDYESIRENRTEKIREKFKNNQQKKNEILSGLRITVSKNLLKEKTLYEIIAIKILKPIFQGGRKNKP